MKTMRLMVCLACGWLLVQGLYGQVDTVWQWLPVGRVFPVVVADPLECQVSGSSAFLFRKDAEVSLYSLVNLGFSKPVIRMRRKYTGELTFGAAVFSQFDLIRRENQSYLAGLMNTDFKVAVDYSVGGDKQVLRFRIFHLSSHLGDDYMQRHADTLLNDKSQNYEQADITWLRHFRPGYLYAGAGMIYTPYAFRKRAVLQAGGLFQTRGPVAFFSSVDCKSIAENEFVPDIRTLAGISVARKSIPLFRLWAEFYSGELPYSTIDYGRVMWVGLGVFVGGE